jgi:methionine-rich copper-binding protein CopC
MRMIRYVTFAACLALPLLAGAAPAFAHAHLKAAMPASGSTVTVSPGELDLKFTEALNLAFTGVKLTGPQGAVALAAPSLKSGDATTLIVPLKTKLLPGSYKVDWHALSDDGHKTQGSYSFSVKP